METNILHMPAFSFHTCAFCCKKSLRWHPDASETHESRPISLLCVRFVRQQEPATALQRFSRKKQSSPFSGLIRAPHTARLHSVRSEKGTFIHQTVSAESMSPNDPFPELYVRKSISARKTSRRRSGISFVRAACMNENRIYP